jgi:hypothetical protein
MLLNTTECSNMRPSICWSKSTLNFGSIFFQTFTNKFVMTENPFCGAFFRQSKPNLDKIGLFLCIFARKPVNLDSIVFV